MQLLCTKPLYMWYVVHIVTQVTDFQAIQNTIKLIFAIFFSGISKISNHKSAY